MVEVRRHVREAVDEPAVKQDLRGSFRVGAVLCLQFLGRFDDNGRREEGGDAVVRRRRRRRGSILVRPAAVATKTEAEGRARRGTVSGLVLIEVADVVFAVVRALRTGRIARARELGWQLGGEGV